MPNFNNLYKIKTTALEQENNLFGSVIKKCTKIRLEGFRLILEKDNDNFVMDLSDIFLHNHIRFPDRKERNLIYYQTTTCEDLKSLIKSISWKNNNLVISDPDYIDMMLGYLKSEMDKNPAAMYLYEKDEERVNICSSFFGIKYQYGGYGKLFFIFKNTIFFCNINNIEPPFNGRIYRSLNKILDIFEEDNER